jgi:hypothetical protein
MRAELLRVRHLFGYSSPRDPRGKGATDASDAAVSVLRMRLEGTGQDLPRGGATALEPPPGPASLFTDGVDPCEQHMRMR